MNTEYENRLELEINRELKRLPELAAPPTLSRRVLAAIQQRAAAPWYRQAWQHWPRPLQFATLGVLLLLFGGLCFGAWELERVHGYDLLFQELARWFSPILSLCNAFIAVVGALLSLVKLLGTPVIIGCLVVIALAWAMCVGLGTLCVRLAFTNAKTT